MLPKKIELRIKERENSGEQQSMKMLRDDKADLFIMARDKIFPIRRSVCSESRLIYEQLAPTDKFCLLDHSNITNEIIVEAVLTLFYGNTIHFNTSNQLEQGLIIIDYLQVDVAKNMIEEQILQVFPQYDVFFILNTAYKYNLRRLYGRCFEQLLLEEFQPMLYNKYDLMQCDFKLFQIVLHTHKGLQLKGRILGVSAEEVEEILKLYCAANHYNQQTYQQLVFRYGKLAQAQTLAVREKINMQAQKQTLKVEKVPLADLARKDGVKSNIYEVKEDGHKESKIISDKEHEEARSQTENKLTEKQQNPNQFPFRAITRPTLQSTDRFMDNAPISPVKKRTLVRRMSEHIDSLGLETPSFPHSQPLDAKMNRSVNLEQLDQKSNESLDHGASIDNNFEMKEEEDADILQVKISHMLDKYENAYQEHDKNFQLMRENYGMKSVMLNEGEQKKLNKNQLIREFQVGKKSTHRIFPSLVESILETANVEHSQPLNHIPRD